MVYENYTGKLQYVCENSYRYLGMTSNSNEEVNVFMEDSNLKVMAPQLFDPKNEKSKFIGLKLDFDTTSLRKKDRSLLLELEDYEEEKGQDNMD